MGVTEVMVKLAKKALANIGTDRTPNEEEFRTKLYVAAELINRRPIAVVPNDSNDLLPLTPQHFLGGANQQATGLPITHSSNIVDRWDQVQAMREKLWIRFNKEILPTLFDRPKWHEELPEMKVDDVVIVLDCPQVLGRWPLGRILRLQKGVDGVVRGVTVRVGDQNYWRHPELVLPLF